MGVNDLTKKGNNSDRKKLVVSLKNVAPEILELLKEKYPLGYSESLVKIDKGMGNIVYAVPLSTKDTDYLIKVDVKVDKELDKIEKELFGDNDEDNDYGNEEETDFSEVEADE